MKKLLPVFVLFFSFQVISSQEMNFKKLDATLTQISDSIVGNNSQWRFTIKNVPFICIADSTYNRMRIISPIANSNRLTDKLKTAALMANFHTALDVKYAISDNVLWAAFIHPLKELSQKQLLDAVSQVYYANVNFGTSFSSTSLVFPDKKPTKEVPKKKKSRIEKM